MRNMHVYHTRNVGMCLGGREGMCLGGGGANYHTLFCIVKNEYYGVCQSRIPPSFFEEVRVFTFLLCIFVRFLLGFILCLLPDVNASGSGWSILDGHFCSL